MKILHYLIPIFGFISIVLALSPKVDPGQPLFLSQYLPNNPDLARVKRIEVSFFFLHINQFFFKKNKKLSQVNGIGNYTSYSGYFTVNSTYGSNMFFWFFPSQNKKPVFFFIFFIYFFLIFLNDKGCSCCSLVTR